MLELDVSWQFCLKQFISLSCLKHYHGLLSLYINTLYLHLFALRVDSSKSKVKWLVAHIVIEDVENSVDGCRVMRDWKKIKMLIWLRLAPFDELVEDLRGFDFFVQKLEPQKVGKYHLNSFETLSIVCLGIISKRKSCLGPLGCKQIDDC